MNPKELLKKLIKEARELAVKAELTDEERARLHEIMGEDGTGTDAGCLYAQTKARVKALEAFEADTDDEPQPEKPAKAQPDEPDLTARIEQAVEKALEPQLKGLIQRGMPAVLRGRLGEPQIRQETIVTDAVKALRRGQFESVSIPLFTLPADDPRYKALAEGTESAGGYLVPVEQSNQIVELLRARAVVRRAGASVVPMSSDSLEIPTQAGGATAYWVAENAEITASDQSFGQIVLQPKKLAALTKLSAELFADSDPAIEQIVQRDLAAVLALEEDIKFLRGDGTGNTPTGLKNLAGVTETVLGAADGAAPTFDDLAAAVYRLDAANAPLEGRAWIMHPRTMSTLRQIKKASGENDYVWSDPAAPGDPPTVWGYPVYPTTAVPINLTTGVNTDTSEIYLGVWPEFLIGQRKVLELRASDAAGNAFEYDQVFIRAIMRVDCNARHAAAFQIVTGVRP